VYLLSNRVTNYA